MMPFMKDGSEGTMMSERSLDRIVRYVRMAESYLDSAEIMADDLLQNHSVASDLHHLKVSINEAVKELDVEYRSTHFKPKTEVKNYGYGYRFKEW